VAFYFLKLEDGNISNKLIKH